ncbi:sulfite exporter TauE/SafE family protein [Patescibacteria group bacterium]|nr:sulfite exporter TauE/SafE family protein [Patescibacteria group bacterium]MBU4579673.1 sulfite exporter TauE/SafE family protein [Patescibacteria group bacterium]
MVRKVLKLFFLALFSAIILFPANSLKAATANEILETPRQNIRVIYFYAKDCSSCQKIKPFIEQTKERYKDKIDFLEHDVKEKDECLQLFLQFIKIYSLPESKANVPVIFAGADYLLGANDIENNLASKIDEKISKNENLLLDCYKFLEDWKNGNRPENGLDLGVCNATEPRDFCSIGSIGDKPDIKTKPTINLSVPSVFTVGFLAGFNPCLLAILAFIASVTLANTGKRRNVLMIVIMFSLGIFVTYLIAGLGLHKIIGQSAPLQDTIKNILVAIVGILGIWHIYDAYYLRKNTESSFHTPRAFIRLTESVTKKVSLPAAFLIGSLFSLIKAPCVGAVYLVILDTMRNDTGTGMIYLASYNLGVVLPVLILGAAIAFGMNPKRVEEFRKDKRVALRGVTGAMLVIIAILMYKGII